jgi:hypothetical protein
MALIHFTDVTGGLNNTLDECVLSAVRCSDPADTNDPVLAVVDPE